MTINIENLVPARHAVLTLYANIDNEKMDDTAFREFVKKSLSVVKEIVEYEQGQQPTTNARRVPSISRARR